MKLFIHTSGRATVREQKTLGTMRGCKPLLKNVELVVQAREEKAYRPIAEEFGVKLRLLPSRIKTLSPTRQYLMDMNDNRFVMMDDDLLFFERREDDPTKFLKIVDDDVFTMFLHLEHRMVQGDHAHAGILAREGGNRILEDVVYNTRMMRVLAYDPAKVRAARARFDRLPSKQDFDMTLQLLRAGYPNMLIANYVQGQYGDGCSNAPGGCSVYRTPAMMKKSSEDLAALHPGFVKVVEKKSTTSWGGQPRIDVVISWKKAAAAGAAK